MTDSEHYNTSDESTAETPSPGAMLREGRERLQLSPNDVAQRLRLRLAIIEDLEQDRFSKYVAGTFTRGYLRAYARLVHVDEEKLFKAYEQLGVEEQREQPMQSFSRRTSQQTHDNRLMAVTYIIGAVIIGSAVIFWWQNSSDEEAVKTGESVSERLVEEQDPQVELEEPRQTESQPITRPAPIYIDPNWKVTSSEDEGTAAATEDRRASSGDEMPADEGTTAEVDTSPQEPAVEEAQELAEASTQSSDETAMQEESAPATEAASEPLPDNELVLSFDDECWIRIEDSTGQAIAFGVKMPGQVVALDGEAPYQVTLGSPESVRLVFRGEDVDLSAYRSGRVARIDLPRTE